MYSNCLYNLEAFAHTKKIPIAPQKFLPMSKPYILHYTLYITHYTLFNCIYSYTIAIAIANKDYTLVNFVFVYSH
jgi:hypothetical protein